MQRTVFTNRRAAYGEWPLDALRDVVQRFEQLGRERERIDDCLERGGDAADRRAARIRRGQLLQRLRRHRVDAGSAEMVVESVRRKDVPLRHTLASRVERRERQRLAANLRAADSMRGR
jgi:hypothetical protein